MSTILPESKRATVKAGGWMEQLAWNLAGAVLPLLAGLIAIPMLLSALGIERFGLLNIAWLLVGYFSLFDLGLGRALTRMVAARIGSANQEEIPSLVATAMRLMAVFGMVAGCLTAICAVFFMMDWLKIPSALRDEMLQASLVLSAGLPFVVLSSGWRGILEAYSRFDWVNWVRIPLGAATFLAPLLALQFADGLLPVVLALSLTRVAGWWIHRRQCARLLPGIGSLRFERLWLVPLLDFGGWLTVSNVIGPLMVYADRFLIGGLVSLAAVSYYATPYEIVTRLWIVSGAATGVLFPRLAGLLVANLDDAGRQYSMAMKLMLYALFPLVCAMLLMAPEGLQLWLGETFSRESSLAARILVVGVFFNVIGQVALTVVHAAGLANWSAKLHLAELPFYCLALYVYGINFGINGVAFAWFLRVLFDAFVMLYFAERILQRGRGFALKTFGYAMIVMSMAAATTLIADWLLRLFLLLFVSAVVAIMFAQQFRVWQDLSRLSTPKG